MPVAKKSAPRKASAKKSAPRKASTSRKVSTGRKVSTSAPATRGPSAETLAFARKVVDLRDKKGLAWKVVADRLKVPYTANGSSRLRRAYTIGGGATVGAKSAK